MNMCRVYDRGPADSRDAVAGECACVVIRRDNIKSEASFAACVLGVFRQFKICIFGNLVIGWNRNTDQIVQSISLSRLKMSGDQNARLACLREMTGPHRLSRMRGRESHTPVTVLCSDSVSSAV